MGVFSVLLALVAVLAALLVTGLFGTVGGVIAGLIAAVAILFGVLKRVKDKRGGIAGIVIAVIAIILAVSMTGTWSNMFKDLHQKAVEYMPNGLWAQATEDVSGGLVGIVKRMPQDEASLNAMIQEMNDLSKIETNK